MKRPYLLPRHVSLLGRVRILFTEIIRELYFGVKNYRDQRAHDRALARINKLVRNSKRGAL